LALLQPNDADEVVVDIRDIRSDDVAKLRRAFVILTREADISGIAFVEELLKFVPSLMPQISKYLLALSRTHPGDVSTIVDQLLSTDTRSWSSWQSLWLIFVLRSIPGWESVPGRVDWVSSERQRGRGSVLGAEATLALAECGRTTFEELDSALRAEPEALMPWFIRAAAALRGRGLASPAQISALRQESPLVQRLLA
jgi:hypothetical protein